MKTVVMLQARLGSTRLPYKVINKIQGKTVVELAMEALLEIPADEYLLVVDEKSHLVLNSLAHKLGFRIFVGPENDVLKRFVMASRGYPSEIIIRATADNPLVSAEAAIYAKELFLEHDADYVGLLGMPVGCGIEVIRSQALFQADLEATSLYDREHVCPYLYTNKDKFKIIQEKAPSKWYFPNLSVTIDQVEDYLNVERIFDQLYKGKPLKIEEFVPYAPEPPQFLFYPSVREGNGLGHLMRSLRLAKQIKNSAFYAEEPEKFKRLVEKTGFDLPPFLMDCHKSSVEWIIVDQRECNLVPEKIKALAKPIISLDEGGELRKTADYIIDSLPNFLEEKSNVDVSPVFYSEMENRSDEDSFDGCDLLISFGGEDPEDLVTHLLRALPLACMVDYKICVVLGANYKGHFSTFANRVHYGKIRWELAPNSLLRFIKNSRLVLTSFGITAYEATSLDKPLFLLEPSKYHHALALKGNFLSWKMNQLPALIKEIKKQLESNEITPQNTKIQNLVLNKRENISGHLGLLHSPKVIDCSFCGERSFTSIHRIPYQTFMKCSKCHTLLNKNFRSLDFEYNENYFFEDYEKQYGKNYLDDYEHIYQMGKERCTIIEKLYIKKQGEEAGNTSKNLLDLGAAYGHFLCAAKDLGWKVAGVDISKNATQYLEQKGFVAICKKSFLH